MEYQETLPGIDYLFEEWQRKLGQLALFDEEEEN